MLKPISKPSAATNTSQQSTPHSIDDLEFFRSFNFLLPFILYTISSYTKYFRSEFISRYVCKNTVAKMYTASVSTPRSRNSFLAYTSPSLYLPHTYHAQEAKHILLLHLRFYNLQENSMLTSIPQPVRLLRSTMGGSLPRNLRKWALLKIYPTGRSNSLLRKPRFRPPLHNRSNGKRPK